jgi:hypothetical protein
LEPDRVCLKQRSAMHIPYPEQSSSKSRPQRLSPELNEFLHMLMALEKQTPAPASLSQTNR